MSFMWQARLLFFIACFALPGAFADAKEPTLCDDPQAQCGKLFSPSCAKRFGAGAQSIEGDDQCVAQLEVYRSCLGLVAQNCRKGGTAGGSYSFKDDWPKVIKGGFEFRLKGCTRSGTSVTCRVVINNNKDEERLGIKVNRRKNERSFLYGPSGIAYPAKRITMGRHSSEVEVGRSFPKDIPLETLIEFEDDAFADAEGSPLLQLAVYARGYQRVDFKKIAFSEVE